MGVERETFERPPTTGGVSVAKLERQASGRWSATLDVDLACGLGDGRMVMIRKQVTVQATEQRGRRPRRGRP